MGRFVAILTLLGLTGFSYIQYKVVLPKMAERLSVHDTTIVHDTIILRGYKPIQFQDTILYVSCAGGFRKKIHNGKPITWVRGDGRLYVNYIQTDSTGKALQDADGSTLTGEAVYAGPYGAENCTISRVGY